MLWTCQKLDLGSPFWYENQKSTIKAAKNLFEQLLDPFQRRTLQHYSIQQVNVIDNILKDLQKLLTPKIKTIILHIYDFIPQNARYISRFGLLVNNKFLAMNLF